MMPRESMTPAAHGAEISAVLNTHSIIAPPPDQTDDKVPSVTATASSRQPETAMLQHSMHERVLKARALNFMEPAMPQTIRARRSSS